MFETLNYILVGLITGISMGAIGIGQVVSMPLLIYCGLGVKQAIAIGLVMQILPLSIPGVVNYWKHILWYESFVVIAASIFGIWLGSYLVTRKIIPEYIIYRFLTIFFLICTIYLYMYHWDKKRPSIDYHHLAT